MTQIMVSKRDGVARAPDGTQYRVHRGKTLADARHPLVEAYPQDWQPMEVHLPVEGDDSTSVGEAEIEQLRNDLAEVEETAESYRKQLEAVAEELARRKLLPENTTTEGWLAEAVRVALDASYGQGRDDEAGGAPTEQSAPKPPRKRAPRTPDA